DGHPAPRRGGPPARLRTPPGGLAVEMPAEDTTGRTPRATRPRAGSLPPPGPRPRDAGAAAPGDGSPQTGCMQRRRKTRGRTMPSRGAGGSPTRAPAPAGAGATLVQLAGLRGEANSRRETTCWDLHDALLSANLPEAILAVDRSVFPRTKRNLGLHSTFSAH